MFMLWCIVCCLQLIANKENHVFYYFTKLICGYLFKMNPYKLLLLLFASVYVSSHLNEASQPITTHSFKFTHTLEIWNNFNVLL